MIRRQSKRVVPLASREGTFPLIGSVMKDFALQIEHGGSSLILRDLANNGGIACPLIHEGQAAC